MATADVLPPPTFETLPQHLNANEGRVEQPQLGWLRPTSKDTPLEEMRERLEKDEYLFVKGVLPREDVMTMREQYFSQFASTGLLKPNTAFADAIYNDAEDPFTHKGIGGGDAVGEELQRLTEAHADPRYRHFLNHPDLRKMVRDLKGWDEEVLLERTMLRHNVPHGAATGVHYDKLFLRGGDAYFLTAWVPIGDIAPNGGGLIYLENSAALGQAIEDDFMRRNADMTQEQRVSAFNALMTSTGVLCGDPITFQEKHEHIAEAAGMGGRPYRWLVNNYEAGDVVFHQPCSIHGSTTNEDAGGRIRLSSDLRFYDKKAYDEGKADERWMKLWTPGDGL